MAEKQCWKPTTEELDAERRMGDRGICYTKEEHKRRESLIEYIENQSGVWCGVWHQWPTIALVKLSEFIKSCERKC